MNQRTLAVSILQRARDTLGERLAQRIIDAEHEIEADAEGGSYLSEIETIYEQLGGRLAHLNAMLSNLPQAASPAPADATASEIIYADLASAYPTGLDLETAGPATLLALPAPANPEPEPHLNILADSLQDIVLHVQAGDMASAARAISELFDLKPSDSRRGARAFSRQIVNHPDLVARVVELGWMLGEMDEHSSATLLAECFEFQPPESLAIVHALKLQQRAADSAP
ncbi:MAG TPA: hypothetical protein VGZ26_02955 [Pirellulales bacterium]|jgi:hypothetical protein|nr:hypothetical protein [Pirellulales bacterium]